MTDFEHHLASLTEAFEKGLSTETFKIIARSKLEEVAKEQWDLPTNPWLSSDEGSSIVVKKKKKGRPTPTPLDKGDFTRRFLQDPSAIKKAELVKAACKNGWGVADSFPQPSLDSSSPPTAGLGGRVQGNKVIKMKNDELIKNLRDTVPELRTPATPN